MTRFHVPESKSKTGAARARPAGQGLETNRRCGRVVGGWWVRADLNVQMAKAKAQSAATWSGSELVCAAVQRGKTLNYVVMTMRL